MLSVGIIGAGIAGLTTALELHERGIPACVYDASSVLEVVGVGINILPHGSRNLGELGLAGELAKVAVITQESVFFNRFGQLIYREPAGRHAGYADPQYSIHRGDLQKVLLDAVRQRLGDDAVQLGKRALTARQDGAGAHIVFADSDEISPVYDVILGCDGVHSAVRKQLYPGEGAPHYTGVNMWRGVTIGDPILSGASMVRAGWLAAGKLVLYPIRNLDDGTGRQLYNWLAEVQTPEHRDRDWNRRGSIGDFLPHFADWHFDWLDVPDLFRRAEVILEYPMVDQDPLPRWSFGRVTLVGDAAHPMVPRGSNGAGQAILDARAIADCLAATPRDVISALERYELQRLPATARVVLTNRTNPPDAILREVYERSGDRPFARIEDVIDVRELSRLSDHYKQVTGMPVPPSADQAR